MGDRTFILLLVLLAVVVAMGAVLDVMEVDAAQYAAMSREMLGSSDWTMLYHRGADYLDKPPLLFWLSATSYELFGIHNWSYKLPSILFAALGLFATYRLALLHHAHEVARTAVLVLGGSAAFLLMTNDVRTDTILTGAVITAIWLGMAWLERPSLLLALGCGAAIAAGLLAKGPLGLMAPALAIGAQVLLTRQWRRLLDARLLLVPLVIALLLLPMCLGLWSQFGVDGLRFYFWEQSFGRITGENVWKDDSTFLYFTHELPWLLLPWTLFLLAGLWHELRSVVRREALPEYASLFGALLVFIGLSASQFKLPHYLYVALPLFAIVTARAMHREGSRALVRIHGGVMALLWLVAMVLVAWSFPTGRWPFIAVLLTGGVAALWWICRARRMPLGATFLLMMTIGIAINGHLYSNILRYQANAQAGKWAARQGLGPERFFGMQVSGTALDHYAGFAVPWLSDVEEARPVIRPGVVIYTDPPHARDLRDAGLIPRRTIPLRNFSVQHLSLEHLDPARRDAVAGERVILVY